MSKPITQEDFEKAMERLNSVLVKAIDYINLYRKPTNPSEKLVDQYVYWLLKHCCCPEDEIKYLISEIISEERTTQEKTEELNQVIRLALGLDDENS